MDSVGLGGRGGWPCARPRDSPGAQLALQRPLCHRVRAAGPSFARWWPSTATLPRGLKTWTCSRGTSWTSCVKVRQRAALHCLLGPPGHTGFREGHC